ncbi:glycosyl transferase family 1 [Reticulibacter mediterranei]|uniref:Glycosyl transferase family 1 n=2 Tax=Reticulibacter mediterranei TaxID=2778369 RepID=A0A8J3IJ85_9CHLR|nr:glycosyl transferase family 1 [Reticulibacter mediterranei]
MNVYMRELACALAKYNVKVDIFTRWTNETAPQVVQLNPQVRVIHIKAGPVAPIHKNDLYQYLPIFTRNIDEFRCREAGQYDLIHSHYWLSGVAGMRLARLWDISHVTTFHTLARLKQLAHPNEPEPPLRLEMEQRLIQHVDRIIAPTVDERTELIRFCGATTSQVDVIPCGVDLDLFVPRDQQQARKLLYLDPQQPVLLFAGRLDPFKGPDLLLRAAAMMEEEAQIVIVGGKLSGDKDVKGLQTLAKELKISQRVHFLGARPRQEMPLIYSAAHVTVVPSYHESFGLAAVESLACGTPVVATRAGGLMTVIQHGETGYLVPRCAGFFAERLDTLLHTPDLYAHMSAAARDSVRRFSWSSVARQVHDVYDAIIDEAECLVAQ